MTLYYCNNCGLVYAFDEEQIRKREHTPVEQRDCVACGAFALPAKNLSDLVAHPNAAGPLVKLAQLIPFNANRIHHDFPV